MEIINIVIICICLSLDAFVLAISKGVIINEKILKYMFITGLFFSIFQCLLFYLGYIFGNVISFVFCNFTYIVSAFFLFIIGIGMIVDSFNKVKYFNSFSFISMIISSIAVSIDSFNAGIICLIDNSYFNIYIIGIFFITFLLSVLGILIGKFFGDKNTNLFLFIGGLVLIILSFNKLFL